MAENTRKRPRVSESDAAATDGARSSDDGRAPRQRALPQSDERTAALPTKPVLSPFSLDSLGFAILRYLETLVNIPDVEIEAKLGTVLDSRGRRVSLPVSSPCVLENSQRFSSTFRPTTSKEQFQRLNSKLNEQYHLRSGVSSSSSEHLVEYKRRNEIDFMFQDQTRISETPEGKLLSCIRKDRASAHCDIYSSPLYQLDVRLSAKTETTVENAPPREFAIQRRDKDRITYTFWPFAFDLTVVKMYKLLDGRTVGHPEMTFEFEIEILDIQRFRRERALHSSNQTSAFPDLAHLFATNILALIRLFPTR